MYKAFLTTTQPPHLYNLIFVQHPRSIRSSSAVTLARQCTDIIFFKKSLIAPFVMLHLVSGIKSFYLFVNLILVLVPLGPLGLPIHSPINSSFDSQLCYYVYLLSFTPGLKPTCFRNPHPVVSLLPDCLHGPLSGPFLLSELLGFCFQFFFIISFLCRALD